MSQILADLPPGWAVAIRQRRRALPQRAGVGVASALVVGPLLGWPVSLAWLVAYMLIQAAEMRVFAPITSGRADRTGPARSAAGGVVMFVNTALYGGLSVPLWLNGGAMGGVCAAILLTAALAYSTLNAPRSAAVLICTATPQFLYMAASLVFMAAHGSPQSYVIAAGASFLVFALFCLTSWQRLNRAALEKAATVAELERRLAAAERGVSGRTAFLATVSHDLRTPIGAILTGAAELTARDPQTRGTAELITDAGLMMKALLDDLLDQAKLDAGRMTVEAADFDLRGLMAHTLRLWKGPVEAKGLRLRIQGARRLPRLARGDAMRLRQVLNNLISNAVKFTETGSVTLRLNAWAEDPSGHALVIEVVDTGPGMTVEQMARLFTAFDQTADGISGRHGGTGLGLAISRELVQLMGGRLTARSAPGEGASFTVALSLGRAESDQPAPLPRDDSRAAIARVLSDRGGRATVVPAPAVEPAPEPAPTPAASPAQPEPEADDRPLRVLVVDDHDINRRAIQLILQPLGCDIAMAPDGRAALEICDGPVFDVIFMDVRMPELDGRETTRRLRAGGGPNAATPVVAVTADTAPEDVAQCAQAGMSYFVSKPLTPTALLGALAQVLADAGAADSESDSGAEDIAALA